MCGWNFKFLLCCTPCCINTSIIIRKTPRVASLASQFTQWRTWRLTFSLKRQLCKFHSAALTRPKLSLGQLESEVKSSSVSHQKMDLTSLDLYSRLLSLYLSHISKLSSIYCKTTFKPKSVQVERASESEKADHEIHQAQIERRKQFCQPSKPTRRNKDDSFSFCPWMAEARRRRMRSQSVRRRRRSPHQGLKGNRWTIFAAKDSCALAFQERRGENTRVYHRTTHAGHAHGVGPGDCSRIVGRNTSRSSCPCPCQIRRIAQW